LALNFVTLKKFGTRDSSPLLERDFFEKKRIFDTIEEKEHK
jgi:hypothetical protein